MAWYDDPGVGRWADLINGAASKYGVDPALLAAHMKVESDGDPKAFNGEYGAAGLMQLIPDTARRLGVSDPFDPQQAIEAGARLIALNTRLAKGDPDLAAAIYFAGTDPKNYGAKTRAYVARINQLLEAWGGDGAVVAQPERTAEETTAGEPAGEKPHRLPLDELFRRGTPIALLMQPEQPEPEAGALRTAGDIGVGLARGAVGLVGAGATLVGAATGNVDNAVRRVTGVVDEWLGSLESPALQAERQAMAEAVAEQSGVFAKGWETYKQLLTRPRLLAQEIAAMAVPMGVAGKIGRMVGAGVAGSMGAQVGDVAGIGASVTLFAAQQGAEVASDVYDRAIEMGAPEDAATDAARQAFLTAAGISLATMLVPGGMTVEKALVRGLAGKEAAGIFARAGLGYIGESLQEGIEEGGGAYAGNISLRSIGLDVDPLAGVGEAFGAGAAVGGPLGGAFGAAQGLAARSTAGTVPLTGDTDTDLRALAGAPVTPPTAPSAGGGPAPAWLDGDLSAINTPAQAPSVAPQVPSSAANAAVPPSANVRQSPPQVPLADIGGMAQARATTPFAPAQMPAAGVPQVPVGAERGATSMGLSQLAALNVTPVAGRDDGSVLDGGAGGAAAVEAAGVLGGGPADAGSRAGDQVLQRGDATGGSVDVQATAAAATGGAVQSDTVERYTVRTDAGNVGVQVERNPDFTVTATTTEATPRTLDIEPMLNAGVSLPEAIRAAVTGSEPRADVAAPTEVGPANQAAVAQWQQFRQQQTENRVRKLEQAQQETEFGDGETEFGEIPEIEPPPAGSAAAEFLRTIASNGGIDISRIREIGGERSGKGTKGIGNPTIPGRGKLFRNNGLGLDELAIRMLEEGYLTEADIANRADNGGVNKLTEMIAAALAGRDVYRAGGEDARAIQRLQAEQQARDFEMMRDEADRLGIDWTGMSFNQLAARLGDTDADVNATAQVAADAQLADEVFSAVIEEYDGDPAFLDAEQRIALAMQYNEAAVERAALQQEEDADFLRAVQEIVDEARARQAAGDRTRSDAAPDREAGQPGSGGPGIGAGSPGQGQAQGQAEGEIAQDERGEFGTPERRAWSRRRAVEYLRWQRERNPRARPQDVQPGIFNGATFAANRASPPLKDGEIEVNAPKGERFKIADLWDEAAPGFDLTQPTTEGLTKQEALRQQQAARQRERDNAPPPEEFRLTGSDRPVDQARAAGQMELEPAAPAAPSQPAPKAGRASGRWPYSYPEPEGVIYFPRGKSDGGFTDAERDAAWDTVTANVGKYLVEDGTEQSQYQNFMRVERADPGDPESRSGYILRMFRKDGRPAPGPNRGILDHGFYVERDGRLYRMDGMYRMAAPVSVVNEIPGVEQPAYTPIENATWVGMLRREVARLEDALPRLNDDLGQRTNAQRHIEHLNREIEKAGRASPEPESRKLAPETEAEFSGEPNESGFIGATDEEVGGVADQFDDAQARTFEGEFQVTHVMDPPAKDEIVRLHDKAGAIRPKKATEKWRMRDGERWLTPEEARAKIEEWKANARKQGETSANRDRVVISMFDLTGEWSKPWEEAGYQVYRFDIQNAGMADIEGREVNVGDITNFSTGFFSELYGMFDGADVYAILAACPCTDFASSGARHFAAKDADGRTIASVELVHHTLATIEFFKPQVWAIENPVGRIEKLTGLPPWRMSFDPFLFGDDYTKQTLLWGRFNADLPTAPVFPAQGSIMHSKYGGKSIATKNARSVTPEGFAYAFFQANNAVDNPLLDVANKYDRLDKGALKAALDAGLTHRDISALVDDFYYMDLDDAAANAALREAAKRGMPADDVRMKLESEMRGYLAQMRELTRLAEQAAKDKIREQYPSQARSRGTTYDRLLREQEQREHEARRGQRAKLQRKVDDVQRRINALERRERLASQPTGTLAEDTLVLMCCSDTKAKVKGPVPLRDLYTGPFWQSLKTNIGAISMDNVFVLSAKHGLQPSSAEFAPYNQKLTEKQVNAWLASRLTDDARKIRARFPRGPRRVIVVGSGAYRSYFDALIEELQDNGDIAPETVVTRTEGAIGIQRKQLNAALAEVNNQTEARDGLQEEGRQGQEVAPTAEAADAARRTRPKNAIQFKNPIVGPSGAKLTGYQWQWTMEEQVDSRGELVGRRVSNWDESVPSADTGREIVHQFGVEMPDGTWQLVSAESAIKLMGFGKQEALKFKSVGTSAKTFARQQMELAAAEQSLATFQADRQAILAGEVPEITVTTEMVDEAPKASPALRRPPVEYTTYTMGDASLSERSEYVRGQRGGELEGFVRQEWLNNRLRERGWSTGTTEELIQGKIAEIRKRIAKTEKRLAELTGGSVEPGAQREPGTQMREGGVKYDVAPTLKPFPVAERREDRRNSLEQLRISPRRPTAVGATEDPMGPARLQPSLEAMRRASPEKFAHNMGLVASYSSYQPAGPNETPDEIAERFIAHMVDNLRWLHDQFPADLRERAKLWYVGANRMAHRWADKYGFTPQQVAAAMAALSPQKHWFMNVSMAERIMDIVTNRADFRWSDRMQETADRILSDPRYAAMREAIRGKTLREVWESGDKIRAAAWVRVFDEAHHYKGVRVVTPEGNFGGPAYGETGLPMLAQWGSFKEISNALSALADGSQENINEALGEKHKVRSFYNNIIAPYSVGGDVTIDTHAVAAALLLPLAGSDVEVNHNFGSNITGEPGPSNSKVTGSFGTYGLYAEAYRRLAAELGILPRELQSITWEAVRGLYEARAKTGKLKSDAKAIWQRYHAGEITDAQAREELDQLAGGITAPSWAGRGFGAGRNAKSWDSSYAGELPGTSLREPSADRAGTGAGSRAAGNVPTQFRQRGIFYEPTGDGRARLGIPLFGKWARSFARKAGAGQRNLDATAEVQFDDQPSPNGFFYARTNLVAESRRDLPVAQVRTVAEAAAAFDSLGKYAVEHFDALVTDANGKPLAIVGSFRGGTSRTPVHAGTIMAEAARIPGASTIWFAHNHPGGSAELSDEDFKGLESLKDLFEGAEFEVAGLFAITDSGEYSFTPGARGILKAQEEFGLVDRTLQTQGASVPVVERLLATDIDDHGAPHLALDRVDSLPRLERHVQTLYQDGATKSLLIFADAQGRVLGYYPIDGAEIEALRRHGRARRLFKAISEANPAGVFIVDNGDLNDSGIYNLGNALKPLEVEVADVLRRRDDGDYESFGELGKPLTSLVDGWMSRGTEGATSAEALPEVRSWAEGVARALEGRVDVVVMDRPPPGMPADAEGAYVDGKLHLFVGNLGSLRRAEEVLAHELFHAGLDRLGPEVAQVLRDIAASNPTVAALADQWARANPGYGRLTAVNEAIAKMSETGDITRQPWWEQLVAAIRAGLRKLGFRLEWSDNDVLRLIRTAHKATLSPAQQTTMQAALASAQKRTWYYSALARAFEGQKDRTMPGAQWAAWLKSNKAQLAVKDDEIEWSGLREYLELRGKDKVSRQDILAFLRENGVRVSEVQYQAREAWRQRLDDLETRGALNLTGGERAELETLRQRRWDARAAADPYLWLTLSGYTDFERDAEKEGVLVRFEEAPMLADDDAPPEFQLVFEVADTPARDGGIFTADELAGLGISDAIVQQAIELERSYRNAARERAARRMPETRYDQYQLPGGENYRELLITLPLNDDRYYRRLEEIDAELLAPEAARDAERSRALMEEKAEIEDKLTNIELNAYRSGHWNESNVLAHVRFNDRTDADGKRVLFVEEIQSDWGQAGRKHGFLRLEVVREYERLDARVKQLVQQVRETEAFDPQLDRLVAEKNAAIAERDQYRKENNLQRNAMGDWSGARAAPFVTDTKAWTALAVKRMVAWAVENGYDRVAFVTGQQSADRYSLEKQVSRLVYIENFERLKAYALNDTGRVVFDKEVEKDKLDSYIGKELAERLLAAPKNNIGVRQLDGDDLKVGGIGMKKFYDQIVPQVVGDVFKKLGGGKAGTTRIDTAPPNYQFRATRVSDNATADFENLREAETFVVLRRDQGEEWRVDNFPAQESEQPAFDITPKMRQKVVEEGLPLFSRPWQPALDAIAAHMDTAKTFNWWHKTVGTQLHKARISPAFARVYNKAEEYIQEVSRFANEAADAAPNLLPRLDKFSDVLKAVRIADEDAQQIAKPIFEGTLLWTRDGDEIVPSRNPTEGIIWTNDELRERYGLNDTQIDYYRQFRAAVDKSLDDLARAQMLRLADRFVRASSDPGRLREDVYAAGSLWRSAQVLADEIRRQRGGDTQEAMAGIERARTAPDAELPNADRDLIDEIEQTAIRVAKLQLNGYAPLMRFGRYSVLVQNAETNEVEFFTTFESEGDAKRAVKELGEQPEFAESKITRGVMSEESWRTFGGMTPEVAEMFGELLGVEQSEAFQVYLRAAKANYSAYKRLIHRKGIPGFSSDPTRTLAAFLTSNARAAAQALHAGEMDRAVQAIEEERGALGGRLGDVLDEARKLVDYVRTPGDAATQIRSFLFFQYIGGSIASALVNMTQPFMMTLPHLTQWTSMGNASRLLAKGMKHAFSRGGLDPELEAALARGERDGVVAPQEIHQLQAEASRRSEGISIGGRKIVSGYNVQRAMFVWGSFFSFAEQINRRSTFIAAYELARERGEADPFAFAERVVVETQGSYTKANRPNWARGPVGATVFTFKQYTIAYLEWLRRLPPKDQAIALGLLVLLAGVQGLPGADDLDDLIDTVGEQLGFATSSKQWKRELATKVLGRTGAEFMMRGVSVFLPLDIAGRMSFGNLFPATGLFKRSETNRTGELLEVAGVGGSALQSLIDGSKSVLRGDLEGAARTAAPIAVQNLYAGTRMALTGEITDRAGRRVDDATVAEGLTKAVGFQPSRVAMSSRQQQEMWQQIRLLKVIEGEIAGDIARGRVDRDVKLVQAARQRLADWNKNNPEARIQISESQIKQRIRALQADRESRLLGNAPREVRQRYQREMEALRAGE